MLVKYPSTQTGNMDNKSLINKRLILPRVENSILQIYLLENISIF